MGLRRILLVSILVAGCTDPGGRCVEASSDDRPGWLTATPADSDAMNRVGRSEHPSRTEAIRAAEADAARQLVEEHYGKELTRDFQRVRDQLESHVTERLSTSATGMVAGLRQRGVFWERCEAPGGFTHRAAVLVDVDRDAFTKAARAWIEKSPIVVEARTLQRVLKQARVTLEHVSQDFDPRVLGFGPTAAKWRLASSAYATVPPAAKRYQELMGAEIPGLMDVDLLYETVQERLAGWMSSLLIAVNGKQKAATLAVRRALSDSKLAHREGRCGGAATLALRVSADPPACEEAGMHTICQAAIEIEVTTCADEAVLATLRIDGPETRGAATEPKAARAKVWSNLSGKNRKPFAAAFSAALGQYVPIQVQ